MKVGVLTFHFVLNYGAMLQAYALCEKINELGHECEIIDYRSDFFIKQYRPIHLQDIKHPRGFLKELLMVNANLNLHKEAEFFVLNGMKTSSKHYSKKNIHDCVDDYDVIIVGSDQVWNMEVNGGDTTYLLDFVKEDNKRVSYAASISMNVLEEHDQRIFKDQLSRYRYISVRETDAKKLLEQITGKDIYVNVDPTLLLNRDKWLELSCDNSSSEYILLYMMSVDDKLYRYALELSRLKGIPVKYVSLYEPIARGAEMVFAPSVIEWVNLYRNARYVVTNSFHGVAFSIIFHKQFVFGLSHNKGKNTRLSSLLEQLGIEDRVADTLDKIDVPINYSVVEDNLKIMREDGENYINMVLKESDNEKG